MKKERDIVVIGLLFIIFAIPYALSQSCTDNQVILKLSGETNAHAELFNQENYNIDVCYNEIFGNEGDGNRECGVNDEFLIMKISNETNAHAESNEHSNYDVSICYNGLECITVDGECSPETSTVIRLSQLTNSHVELVDKGNYRYSICCTAQDKEQQEEQEEEEEEEIIVKEVYWSLSSNKNSILAENARVNVGNIVYLIAEGIQQRSSVNFKIFDDEGLLPDQLLREELNKNDGDDGNIDGIAIFEWHILESEYNIGKGILDEILEIYFTADSTDYIETSYEIKLGPGEELEEEEEEEEIIPERCEEILTEEECEGELGEKIIKDYYQCPADRICECKYNNDKCVFVSRPREIPEGGDEDFCIPTCERVTSISKCDSETEKATVNIISAELVTIAGTCTQEDFDNYELSDGLCIERSYDKDCRVIRSIELPYFSFTHFLISLILISLFYLYIVNKKHIKNESS